MKPDVTRLLDEQLMTAISNQCSHPAHSTQIVDDPRFGEQCADCLVMAHEIIEIVDEFGVDSGSQEAPK